MKTTNQKDKSVDTTPQNTKTLFSFNLHDDVPQIPRLQDVLYVLEISKRQEYYSICKENMDVVYLLNIRMVVEAVGNQVKALWPSDSVEARRIVARTIVSLCPEEAKCLSREAFVNAKRDAEGTLSMPFKDGAEIIDACVCPYHKESRRLRALSTD